MYIHGFKSDILRADMFSPSRKEKIGEGRKLLAKNMVAINL